MARHRIARVALAIAPCVAVTGVQAQAPSAAAPATPRIYPGRLVGVYDERSGEPIEGVEIKNLLNGLSALTTSTGTLSLFFVDTSGALITLRKLGYEPMTMAVANSYRDTTPITITMKSAQVLPAVTTTGKRNTDSVVAYRSPALQGFEERRHQGFGHFVSEEELRKKEGSRLSEVLTTHLPGVHLVPIRGGSALVTQRLGAGNAFLRTNPNCYVTVFVDGVVFYSMKSSGSTPPDITRFFADDYAGVEYYAGGATVPPQYNATDSGCGLLLLWTRER
jgi:hypothetical protein